MVAYAGDTQPADSQSAHRGALFKVQDARHTLYLFGTIHVGATSFYPLEPRVMQALEQAPAIVLETDPQNTASMQAALQRYGFYPEGQTYQSDLSPQLQQQLHRSLARYDIASAAVARFRPWMLASLLMLQTFDRSGYRADLAVDSHLANHMRLRNKPVIELEGAMTQLALFDALSRQEQTLMLEDTLKELDDPGGADEGVQLVQFWRTGNLAGLQRLLDDMARDKRFVDRFTKEVLLDQRNPALADQLAALLLQQDCLFAAIGILHLVGPTGVPSLLQQRGLKVERLF